MSPSNLQILAYESTSIGTLCLRRRELLSEPGTVVTEITLDHEYLMGSYNTESERALSRCGLELCSGAALDVLVGGLGLGYTAWEALASERVRRVEVVELLPEVIGWLDQDLFPLASRLAADARFAVREGDVYTQLAARPQSRYDLVLIDVDHSPDEQLDPSSGSFYLDAGLEAAKAHLNPGGVLGVWSYAESSPFADALRRMFGEVRVEPVRFDNPLVGETQTDWLFFARD